jgi:hypothetical protein
MPVHVYVMQKELNELKTNWETRVEYEPYLKILQELPTDDEEQTMMEGAMNNFGPLFFKIAIKRFEKNFVQWRTAANLQLMLRADDITSKAFAHYLLS